MLFNKLLKYQVQFSHFGLVSRLSTATAAQTFGARVVVVNIHP